MVRGCWWKIRGCNMSLGSGLHICSNSPNGSKEALFPKLEDAKSIGFAYLGLSFHLNKEWNSWVNVQAGW
jgi:hypothetical protein